MDNKTSILVSNSMGSVGKTTVSLILGESFAHKGKSIAMLDLDYSKIDTCQYFATQKDLAKMFDEFTLHGTLEFIMDNLTNILRGVNRNDLHKSVSMSLIYKENNDNFAVVATKPKITKIYPRLSSEHLAINHIIKYVIEALHFFFDVVIIDTPPDIINPITQSAFAGAENLLIVTDVSEFSYAGINSVIDYYERVSCTSNTGLNLSGIVVNKYKKYTNNTDIFFETLMNEYTNKVFFNNLPEYEDLANFTQSNNFIPHDKYKEATPNTKKVINNFFEELLNRIN